MIKTGIYGATGYTGFELVRLLHRHPAADIAFATSQSHAGKTLRQVFPAAPELPLISAESASPGDVEVVFLCLPHAAAATVALAALDAGTRVIDLSADFRLRDADDYARWYGQPHPAAQLLSEAVYGLTEAVRDRLPGTRLVANPGCYPTGILLALRPLLTTRTRHLILRKARHAPVSKDEALTPTIARPSCRGAWLWRRSRARHARQANAPAI